MNNRRKMRSNIAYLGGGWLPERLPKDKYRLKHVLFPPFIHPSILYVSFVGRVWVCSCSCPCCYLIRHNRELFVCLIATQFVVILSAAATVDATPPPLLHVHKRKERIMQCASRCYCSNKWKQTNIKKNRESLAFNHPHSIQETATRTTTTIADKWYHHRILHSRFPFRKKGIISPIK